MKDKDTLRAIRATALRSLLIEKARRRQLSHYGQWMKVFDIDRFELAEILGRIVELDAEMGTPPVACLVVRKDTMVQGKGFALKVSVERLNPEGLDATSLSDEKQKQVFDFYAK
jgi:hypothetical protein